MSSSAASACTTMFSFLSCAIHVRQMILFAHYWGAQRWKFGAKSQIEMNSTFVPMPTLDISHLATHWDKFVAIISLNGFCLLPKSCRWSKEKHNLPDGCHEFNRLHAVPMPWLRQNYPILRKWRNEMNHLMNWRRIENWIKSRIETMKRESMKPNLQRERKNSKRARFSTAITADALAQLLLAVSYIYKYIYIYQDIYRYVRIHWVW